MCAFLLTFNDLAESRKDSFAMPHKKYALSVKAQPWEFGRSSM
jgi:hypothetical protein